MGSLNGDVMVMRNGRSTSQISIYNYPEHLNPFYEDDQHKRLRFWKINKRDNEGRRNSFSIGNLRDMLAFKSFRMKKKSSTLGINKTSESPPTLRRDFAIDNGWNTFDHRLRDSNTASLNGDNFQRNATYRSSLQTLPISNADRIGLNRNDGYRSTIQVARSNQRYQSQLQQQQRPQSTGVSQNRRYVYGGSVTPQPMRNTIIGRGSYENGCDSVLNRRSSQSSMVSTNPFESDDDDENEDINSSGIRSVNGGSTTTLTSRTPRKKRKAPAPPTPIHSRNGTAPLPTILIESSHDSTNDELRIKEDIDIANLTAEIQSFVETTNNDDVEISQKPKDNKLNETTTETVETKEKDKRNSLATEELKTNEVTTINITTSNDVINTVNEEQIKQTHKTNGQITTGIVNVTTTTTTATSSSSSPLSDDNKPVEHEQNVTKVANVSETETNESKEIKTNGAIPKKPNKIITDNSSSPVDQQQSINVVDELCIKETKIENKPQKPVPLKRQTKPEQPEVGHVECIHVHVESPKPTLRKEHQNSVSSFKTSGETQEGNETITTKTKFVLTSPPNQRRKMQPQTTENTTVSKETVKIIRTSNETERINELNINEERPNAKPAILVKPTLSPKPVLKEANGKIQGFAEIHKPIRSKFNNNQNGQSVSTPIQPLENVKAAEEEEKKINNITSIQFKSEEKQAVERNENQLKIVENSSTMSVIKPTEPMNKEQHTVQVNSATLDKAAKEDEFELLYRPKPATHMEWKRSTLAPLETNIPPEKRKSVKDIIESINRSQRLLNAAANKDFTALPTTTTTTNPPSENMANANANTNGTNNNNINEDLRILEEKQKEIQRMFKEIDQRVEHRNGVGLVSLSPSPSPSNYNNEIADAQKLDNNEVFQKCKVKKEVYDYRESSPISSNLDWNPLPKPKRTKPGHD